MRKNSKNKKYHPKKTHKRRRSKPRVKKLAGTRNNKLPTCLFPHLSKSLTNAEAKQFQKTCKNAKDNLKNIRPTPELSPEPEDYYGWHINSEFDCFGCEGAIDNPAAHCTACNRSRGLQGIA